MVLAVAPRRMAVQGVNVPRCGRCRGRGYIRPLDPQADPTCPDCEGSGDKPRYKPKPKVEPAYDGRPSYCTWEGREGLGPCSGRLDWHHIIPRGRIADAVLKGRGLTPDLAEQLRVALSDRRVLVGACNGHHLGPVENASPAAQLREDELPCGFWDYVAEHGLEDAVPRYLRRAEAA